ncbi:MAG: hypothetical protein HY961_12470 [Ignavibacteriae bacterium]|nr:hypothetical protein [Ignavibacteriota bacterium]
MSWILGVLSANLHQHDISRIAEASVLHATRTPSLSLFAGGSHATCLVDSAKDTTSGWIVVGLGIKLREEHTSILAQQEWHALLSKQKPDLDDVDGHFVAVRWTDNRVECFSDRLGLRELYFCSIPGGIVFSTRVDWVSELANLHELDFQTFGVRWLAFNQFSYRSPILGIQRLGPHGRATFTLQGIEHANRVWEPSACDGDGHRFEHVLQAFTDPKFREAKTVSVGLSGGIDSRLLLALTLNSERKPVAHTFGSPQDPDVIVATKIAGALHLDHHVYDEPLPEASQCIVLAKEFAAQTILKEPASGGIRFRYYEKLAASGRVVVDGAFGEVLRRQYYNRLLWVGRDRVLRLSHRQLLPFLQAPRVDIFSDEAKESMMRGFEREVEYMKDLLRLTQHLPFEDALDILAVQARIPNYAGAEQARMDSFGICYMPFCQPTIFDAGLALPLSQRRNGRLLKEIIRSCQPKLARFPLAQGGSTSPFWFSTTARILTRRAKIKLGRGFVDTTTHDFLHHVREFVRDQARSTCVTSFGMYDGKKIQSLVETYYRGEQGFAHQLDWWLGFELWRQSMKLH